MVVRRGHLWQRWRVVASMLKPVLVLIVHPCKLILLKLTVPQRRMDAGMTSFRCLDARNESDLSSLSPREPIEVADESVTLQ